MKLPNADRALVDIRKLRDYCLNPASPRGQAKARVFHAALGVGAADADGLRRRLLKAALEEECVPGESDEFGKRYTLDFRMETATGKARVRSGWIVRRNEHVPRLTTCYVLLRRRIL
jgi:hypothetical protein